MIRRSGGETSGRPASTSSFMNVSRGKKIWTVEEDEQLKALVALHGTGNWTLVAQSLPERTGKQCRERWHNHLGSGIKKGDWTEEEDKIIVTMQRHIGNQWAKITKMLPGRTDNAVKNRFHATERAKSRGKGEELYNVQADQEFFEKLKRLHTDIDFDLLCEQHASSLAQGTADQSSVDNARTSSITGSDASSRNGSKTSSKRARYNDLALTGDDDEGYGDDDALSEEEVEEDDEHEDDGLGMMMDDTLMDIDIINFDDDDIDLDLDFGTSIAPQETRGPSNGDNCCSTIFDWGCSTYYKNVFNPAERESKRNNVGLPGSSSAQNNRPQQFSNSDFYNLPPAVELTPTPTPNQQQQQQQQQPVMHNQAQVPYNQSPTHSSPHSPHTPLNGQTPHTLPPQQQQQQQLMYATLPVAPNQPILLNDQYQQVQQVQYASAPVYAQYPTSYQPQYQVAYQNGQQVYIQHHPYNPAAMQGYPYNNPQNMQNMQNIQNMQNMQYIPNTYATQYLPQVPTQQIGIGSGGIGNGMGNSIGGGIGSGIGSGMNSSAGSRPVSTSSYGSAAGSYNENRPGSYSNTAYLA